MEEYNMKMNFLMQVDFYNNNFVNFIQFIFVFLLLLHLFISISYLINL